MLGTREQILRFVVDHREVRVETLADAMSISIPAVRRHLDHLRADGLLDVKSVKQTTGRPYYAYFATEAATGALPASYADLLGRMLHGLDEREDVISTVMTSVAESLASRHRGEISSDGSNEGELVGQVTASLRSEGILDHWHAAADGFHLTNGLCPYLKAAEMSRLPCESDRKAIELLLGTEVLQLTTIVDGSSCCEYVVRAAKPAIVPAVSTAAKI